jgi:hypothetical protein
MGNSTEGLSNTPWTEGYIPIHHPVHRVGNLLASNRRKEEEDEGQKEGRVRKNYF